MALWLKNQPALKEWAYAGIFFNLLLAASAHINIGDGEAPPAIIGIVILMTSYFTGKKLMKNG